MQKITILETHRELLFDHAENEKPNESCAILFGTTDNEYTIVKDVFLTKNTESSPINFTISNEQLIEGYNIAEEKKMAVVGIFHSHPRSIAFPSTTDKKFMQSNPVVWVIYSGITNEFKSYILDEDIIEVQTEFQLG